MGRVNPRKDQWLPALIKHWEDSQTNEFVWGENDCFQFVSKGILAMTGTDIMAGLEYYDLIDVKRLFKAGVINGEKVKGPKTAEGFWRYWLGETKPVLEAQRGDVVLFANDGVERPMLLQSGEYGAFVVRDELETPGIVSTDGKRVWMKTKKDGIAYVLLEDGDMAWSV